MIIKIVTFFLIGIAILALFGRLRLPWQGPRKLRAARCPNCGRPQIGQRPCDCGGKA
ncbi:hypothetical protein DEA8626_02478 [Defluviimonas aquaemixtae]|uniref:Uncharacterized protein n=1 Tax=Albidovulum aquaemixtae TaxID=1542388 RepID=A0A2R8BJ35_9RHOB|nr:hypothetical protein [Defluviimonas aquaemixtae]SPH23415.1 hypothetical protein DEA8626_02478 [Defluviimonas aquaemixtae]